MPSAQPAPGFFQRAVRNFLFSGLGTLSNFVLGFLFAGLTIRYLGEARSGFFMALAALTGLNAMLGDFGLGAPAVHRVAALNGRGELARARTVVGSVCTAALVSSLVIAALLLVLFPKVFGWSQLAPGFRSDAFWATVMTLGSVVLTQAAAPWRATYNALERYDLTSLFNSLFGLLSGLGGIGILLWLPTMSALAAVRLALSAARFVVDAYFMRRLLGGTPWPCWAWGEVRAMAGFGGWVYLEGVGSLLSGRVNSLVLTSFLGSAALPYYELPQRFYTQIHTALANQSQFLFPMLASYGDEAAAQIRRLEDRLRWFIAAASGALYTGLALVGPDLLDRVVSPAFAGKIRIPLYLVCIQGFFQAQDIIPYYVSYALGRGKPNSIIPFVQGSCVALTAVFLIPRYGVLGVCLAQLWVVPAIIAHTIWVRRLIAPELPVLEWLKAFGSPAIMVLVWLALSQWLRGLLAPGIAGSCLSTAVGGLAGLTCLLAIEARISSDNGRWEALSRMIRVPIQRLVRRGS